MIHGLNNTFLYAVTQLQCTCRKDSDTKVYSGTGFFVVKDNEPYLITNRHVAEPNYKNPSLDGYKLVEVVFHNRKFNEQTQKVDLEECRMINWNLQLPEDKNDDVACFYKMGVNNPFSINCFVPISFLATKEIIENKISVCDSIAFIGFPEVYDHKNNLAILRTGTISSDPRLDYSYSQLVDLGHVIAYEAFSKGGSSGSPVFALQKGFSVNGDFLKAREGFYREVCLVGINAGSVIHKVTLKDDVKYDEHQQLSYMYKSYIILDLIEKASVELKKTCNMPQNHK